MYGGYSVESCTHVGVKIVAYGVVPVGQQRVPFTAAVVPPASSTRSI